MKKLAKKSIGGPGGPNSLRTAINDSTAASNFEKTKVAMYLSKFVLISRKKAGKSFISS